MKYKVDHHPVPGGLVGNKKGPHPAKETAQKTRDALGCVEVPMILEDGLVLKVIFTAINRTETNI